jgi:putative ABC transport system ATP-binding protein
MPAFSARGVTKTYRMGEVEVAALQGIDLDLFAADGAAIRLRAK